MLLRRSQAQTSFAGAVGDSRDTSCVLAAATVKDNCLDTGLLGALGDELADLACLGGLVTVERAEIRLERGCRSDRVALGVIDIISKVGFYDYRAKYSPGGSQHILPADIPKDVYRKCQQYSLQAHRALGCRGVSRSDFRYDDTHGTAGELILLEINTQPGMTGTSLVPELAAHSGHSYEELVTWMVNDASINR